MKFKFSPQPNSPGRQRGRDDGAEDGRLIGRIGGLKRKHGRDDVDDDDDVSDAAAERLSAGTEAARDVIDAYKSSMKETRKTERVGRRERRRKRRGRGGSEMLRRTTGSERINGDTAIKRASPNNHLFNLSLLHNKSLSSSSFSLLFLLLSLLPPQLVTPSTSPLSISISLPPPGFQLQRRSSI